MPGAEQGRGLAARHGLGGDSDRRRRLPAQRGGRRFVHGDDLAGVHDPNPVAVEVVVTCQLGVDNPRRTNQNDAQVEVPGRGERAVHDRLRPMVAAHRVNSNPDHRVDAAAGLLLLFVNGSRLTAAVVPAVRADAVRRLRFVAVRADAETGRLQRVMGPPLGGTGLRVSSFRIRHRQVLLSSWQFHVHFGLSAFSAASRGSSRSRLQSQVTRLRFVPQSGHSPWHASLHSGFIGSDRRNCSRIN